MKQRMFHKRVEPGGIHMQGHISTELGSITIDADVIAAYAGSVAIGCSGIVGMATLDMRDGLMKLLKKDSINWDINVWQQVNAPNGDPLYAIDKAVGRDGY